MGFRKEIETEFIFKQKVFCIEEYREVETCNLCDGEKSITALLKRGKEVITCPKCEGSGQAGSIYKILWKLKGENAVWVIDNIRVWLSPTKKPDVHYGVTHHYPGGGLCSCSVREEDCFASLSKALDEIDRRNANPEIDYDED